MAEKKAKEWLNNKLNAAVNFLNCLVDSGLDPLVSYVGDIMLNVPSSSFGIRSASA